MSILDKLRNMFSGGENEERARKADFKSLGFEIEKEEKNVGGNINRIKLEIKQKMAEFISLLEEKTEILEAVDIEKIRENEKIKLIVKENLNLYISYLQNLEKSMEKIEDMDFKGYFKKIISVIENFNKNSKNAFEKSTILIGKEIGNIADLINDFSNNLKRIIDENKEVFEKESQINEIKGLLLELKDSEDYMLKVGDSVNNFEKSIFLIKERMKESENSIKLIKESREYKEAMEEKKGKEREKQEIEKKIYEIKQEIDLRQLSKHFHDNKKKSGIIKKYADNFYSAVEEDSELKIIGLVKEAGNLEIDYLKELVNRKKDINNIKPGEDEKKLLDVEDNIRRLELELSTIGKEIDWQNKKKSRIFEKIKEIKERIKDKAKALLIEVN